MNQCVALRLVYWHLHMPIRTSNYFPRYFHFLRFLRCRMIPRENKSISSHEY